MEEHIAALQSPCTYLDYAWGDTDQAPLAALRRYPQTSTIMKSMGWHFMGSDRAVQWDKAPPLEQAKDRLKVAHAAHARTVAIAQKERPFDLTATALMMTQSQDGTITPAQFKERVMTHMKAQSCLSWEPRMPPEQKSDLGDNSDAAVILATIRTQQRSRIHHHHESRIAPHHALLSVCLEHCSIMIRPKRTEYKRWPSHNQ